ncbi:hypothetical protein CIB48_g10364 [Xylaria polymorpha]|nr:hypothetical protein CIB48_g10364 [Xylaria polymorpha]
MHTAVSTTRPIGWRRACVTCTKAKRQCSKEVPRCRRCLEKNKLCTYPPPRRPETSAAVGVDETPLHLINTALDLDEGLVTAPAAVVNQLDVPEDAAFAFLQMTEADFDGLALPTEDRPREAHRIRRSPLRSPLMLWSLKQYIEQVQLWMRQWVTEDHSPLHHRDLYSQVMPRHTQDAYTAMTMYMSKTRETEATVYRILEDRVSQLLQDHDVEASLGNAGGDGLSIFNRLSRVQSLLLYQLIRLFDGDIRMRGQAENLIPTLFLWNEQMLKSAKDSLRHPECFLISSPFDLNSQPGTSNATGGSPLSPNAVWQAWIVAESVRRTWQASNLVQAVYQFFKRGWSECPGRLPSTMRKALWDAPSAYLWTKELGGGKDPLLLPMARFDEVFSHIPAEVDDFNMVTIGLYGMEKGDQWLEEKGYNRPQLISGL